MVATDEKSFALIFETWDGPMPIGPTYGAPFHQGLYRMAMAVDDVHAAWRSLAEAGMAVQPPYTFAMPGTKITDGLTILFIRVPTEYLSSWSSAPAPISLPPLDDQGFRMVRPAAKTSSCSLTSHRSVSTRSAKSAFVA